MIMGIPCLPAGRYVAKINKNKHMKQHPFAMLIGHADGRSVATQIPLLVEERNGKMILLGYVMKKQDHQLAFEKNQLVGCVY